MPGTFLTISDERKQLKRLEMFREGGRTALSITETKGEEFYQWNMSLLLIFYVDFNFTSRRWPYYSLYLFLNESDTVGDHIK